MFYEVDTREYYYQNINSSPSFFKMLKEWKVKIEKIEKGEEEEEEEEEEEDEDGVTSK
jgi:hypothetical protein